MTSYPPEVIRPQRHDWDRTGTDAKTCARCGTRALRYRDPVLRKPVTEWTMPDGTRTDNRWGGKVPPCTPPEDAATAGGA